MATPDIPDILNSDVGCKTVANMIKGKTPEEIRKLFNIVNDFTPEEEVLIAFICYGDDSLTTSIIGSDQEGKRETPILFAVCFVSSC